MLDEIVRSLRAGVRGLSLVTPDEAFAVELMECAAARLGWPLHVWSAASGLDRDMQRLDLLEWLQRLQLAHDDAVCLLLDPPQTSAANPALCRSIRELAQRTHGPAIMLVTATDAAAWRSIPELVSCVLPLPDRDELRALVERAASLAEDGGLANARIDLERGAARIAHTMVGMHRHEAERALAEAMVDCGSDADAIVQHVARAKLERAGNVLLDSVLAAPSDELGGLVHLKAWLARRALAFAPEARRAGIPDARGLLLLGVQGCGKSLAARVCAHVLDLPLVRLEPGRLFGGTVGESEANLRLATQTAERLAPVVLWVDEIEKGFAGADGGASDGGTASRVLGSLLTWLQERQRPVFLVATANRIEGLPPELLRRGRLDEVFFVDLPDADARVEILRVHLERLPARRLGHAPAYHDDFSAYAALVREYDGMSGAEIESAVIEARLAAFAEARPLTPTDLAVALAATVPLSRTFAESIASLRAWASTRARMA